MKAPTVPVQAKQGAEVLGIPGMEASIWAERMVTALVNGVEGGQWYSLMDKVYATKTLALAWAKVRDRRGAARTRETADIGISRFPMCPVDQRSELAGADERRFYPVVAKPVGFSAIRLVIDRCYFWGGIQRRYCSSSTTLTPWPNTSRTMGSRWSW